MIGKKHENILDAVVEILRRENKEITQASIRSYVMTQTLKGDEKLGRLTNKPIHEYCTKKGIK